MNFYYPTLICPVVLLGNTYRNVIKTHAVRKTRQIKVTMKTSMTFVLSYIGLVLLLGNLPKHLRGDSQPSDMYPVTTADLTKKSVFVSRFG